MSLSPRQLRSVSRLSARVDRWGDCLREERKKYAGVSTEQARVLALQDLRSTRLGTQVERVCKLCFAICDRFPSMEPASRRALVACVQHSSARQVQTWWEILPRECSTRIKSNSDQIWLERGLIAALVGGGIVDWRDTLMDLNYLYRAARNAGLNAAARFQEVAMLASSAWYRNCFDMAGCLAGFPKHHGPRVDAEIEYWESL